MVLNGFRLFDMCLFYFFYLIFVFAGIFKSIVKLGLTFFYVCVFDYCLQTDCWLIYIL